MGARASRKEAVRLAVVELEEAGVIRGDWQLLGQRPGLRWLITLRQPEQGGGWWASERALTTAEAEALVNGALTGYALGRQAPEPPAVPAALEALDWLELRAEVRRVIGEDRVPLEALRELLAAYSDVDYEQAQVEAAELRAWGGGGP